MFCIKLKLKLKLNVNYYFIWYSIFYYFIVKNVNKKN